MFSRQSIQNSHGYKKSLSRFRCTNTHTYVTWLPIPKRIFRYTMSSVSTPICLSITQQTDRLKCHWWILHIYNLHTDLSYRLTCIGTYMTIFRKISRSHYIVPSFLTKAKQKQKQNTEYRNRNSDSDTHTTHMNNNEKPKCTSTYIEYYLHIHIFNVYC